MVLIDSPSGWSDIRVPRHLSPHHQIYPISSTKSNLILLSLYVSSTIEIMFTGTPGPSLVVTYRCPVSSYLEFLDFGTGGTAFRKVHVCKI